MLAQESLSTKVIYNNISKEYNIFKIIIEKKPSTVKFFSKRIQNLGMKKVLGQLCFFLFNVFYKRFSKKHINSLIQRYEFITSDIPDSKTIHVDTINSQIVIDKIAEISPHIIVVNGTRIISKKVLNSTNAIFINSHLGITPKYRGVHGGYWALINDDPGNFGVTVHLVDRGIDTGSIVFQEIAEYSGKDNFNSYTIRQLNVAKKLINKSIENIINKNLKTIDNKTQSILWSHPTLFEYLSFWIKKGIN